MNDSQLTTYQSLYNVTPYPLNKEGELELTKFSKNHRSHQALSGKIQDVIDLGMNAPVDDVTATVNRLFKSEIRVTIRQHLEFLTVIRRNESGDLLTYLLWLDSATYTRKRLLRLCSVERYEYLEPTMKHIVDPTSVNAALKDIFND